MAKLEPGEIAALGFLAGGLATSAALVALGHEPTSTCVRRDFKLKVAYGLLFIHMAFSIPGDPLTNAGAWIARTSTTHRAARLAMPIIPLVPDGMPK